MPMIPKIEVPEFDPKRDMPKDRKIKLANNIIHIISGGPFGFYTIHYDKGQVPEQWKGEFTSIEDAKRAVRNYLINTGREPEIQGQL